MTFRLDASTVFSSPASMRWGRAEPQSMTRFPPYPAPTKAGAGFKPQHLAEILADREAVGFFEIHAENYMGKGGAPHAALARIRERFPVFVHGVGLSIGSPQPFDPVHLERLKVVVERYDPLIVSEHLAWSTHETHYLNDLLPVPYTREVLGQVVGHINEVQDTLKRQMLLENPSTYVRFAQSTMSETNFIAEIAKRTGCGLLLDLNNVFVSATNHDYSPDKYLDHFPLQHVQEIHLAGHDMDWDDAGHPLLIDAHDRQVSDDVWRLYADIIRKLGPTATLIEWDNDVPAWQVLKSEAKSADIVAAQAARKDLAHAS